MRILAIEDDQRIVDILRRALTESGYPVLVKPFHLSELLARVRALLHRAPRAIAPVFTVRDVTLDTGLRPTQRGAPLC